MGGGRIEPAHSPIGADLAGDLGRFLPGEVFQLLALVGASGTLGFERGEERVELLVDRGRVQRAITNRGSVRIGEVLVHRGAISSAALDHALERQRGTPDVVIGELLAEAGDASREQVAWAAGEVVRRILLGVLLWGEGHFRFAAHPTRGPSIEPEIDLDRTLLDCLRLVDELKSDGPPGSR